jgi:putative membrane protein
MKGLIIILSFATGVLLCACKKDNFNTLNARDQYFLVQAALANNSEILLGQLAATKGNSNVIRSFGQQMVTEYTSAQNDLHTLMDKLQKAMPDSIDVTHHDLLVALNSLSGHTFDTAFINSQVTDHKNAEQLYQYELNDGSQIDVRGYANKYVDRIIQNYLTADSLSRAIQ